ncbi:MAG TPA: hypothetical protein PKH69_02780 [Thiobacillaceae bacterium]|nr:hypothetical protein [Thiobacillaceae bacterium]HNU63012.1 hypothetical protein [Thiobacillaceae bacterium]
MTAKHVTLLGLLLSLNGPLCAEPVRPVPAQVGAEQAQSAPATPHQPRQVAWQRVGVPLSLEG